MEDTKQLTDNELIAEFMGLTFKKEIDGMKYYNVPSGHIESYNASQGEFKYHKRWDWLMPVVEKISQHIYESYSDHNGYKEVTVHDRAYPRTFGMIDNNGKWMVRINRMPLEQEKTLIQATYKAVVEWIKSNQPQKAS